MAKLFKQFKAPKLQKTTSSWLSYDGTLPRGRFIKTYLILAFINYTTYTFAPFLSPLYYEWVLWSIFVFTAIVSVFQIIKRLRDLGRSPYLAFILLIPFINLYVIYLVFVKK